MENNIILKTDSYKFTHYKQYPPKTQHVYSYFESRGGWPVAKGTLFFGLQYILKRHFQGIVLNQAKIDEAEPLVNAHFGYPMFNRAGWERLLAKHGGRLPVVIKAVPEGTYVEKSNVLFTIENTDPEFFWLTNYLETLLVQMWYPITVATLAYEINKLILHFLTDTADSTAGSDFKLHDFGERGVSSLESAGIGGCAQQVVYKGSDTVQGMIVAMKYYGATMPPAYSVPAAEHSTVTSWPDEAQAYANMLTQFPTGLVAVVSDSYDIYNAVANIWGGSLKELVLARDGTLVIRPDSGDPATVVLKVLQILWEKFGGTINSKGYKVLHPKVRVIQGDGINYDSIQAILNAITAAAFSTENVVFGMGGALLQQLNRDTHAFAMKCSSIVIDGKAHDVFKKPITDSGKNSKRGRLSLVHTEHGYATMSENSEVGKDELVEVFRDGVLLKEYTFDEIRQRAAI